MQSDGHREHRRSVSAALFDALWDAPVGIALLDRELRFLRVNPTLAKVHGRTVEDHIGRPLEEVAPQLSPSLAELLRRVIQSGTPATDVILSRPLGACSAMRHWLGSYYAIQTAGGEVIGVGCVFVEITDRKRMEEQAEEARARAERVAERLTRLQEVTSALSEAATPPQVAEAVFRHGVRVLRAKAAFLSLVCDDRLDVLHSRGLATCNEERELSFPLSAAWPPCDAVRLRQAIWLGSREEIRARYPPVEALPAAWGDGAWAAIPLLVKDRPIGALSFAFDASHRFDPEEREFSLALAGQCAQALDRIHELSERKRAEELQRLIVGIVGHDLRTPLAAIFTSAKLLQLAGELTARQTRLVSSIQRAAARMESLARDLLDFTRARSARGIPVAPRPVHMDAICREAIQEAEASMPGCSIDYAPEGEGNGEWDPDRLAQLLGNLLSNALTHGEPGAPVALRWQGQPDHVVLRVENRGKPIPADSIPRLFEPFGRLAAPRGRHDGAGLGLFIAREIARAHGGCIEVTSGPSGTVVSTWLPRRGRAGEPLGS
jgi:PAS domain S-box-containing protein